MEMENQNFPGAGLTNGPEYVTGAVSMLENDGIVIHVTNDSNQAESINVMIYQNTGAGATVVIDQAANLPKTWTWGLGFTVLPPQFSSGEYWVRIRTSSPNLIPTVKFERSDVGIWKSFVTYRPGDFAIFKYMGQNRYRD
jgi:hypothetical protein